MEFEQKQFKTGDIILITSGFDETFIDGVFHVESPFQAKIQLHGYKQCGKISNYDDIKQHLRPLKYRGLWLG